MVGKLPIGVELQGIFPIVLQSFMEREKQRGAQWYRRMIFVLCVV